MKKIKSILWVLALLTGLFATSYAVEVSASEAEAGSAEVQNTPNVYANDAEGAQYVQHFMQGIMSDALGAEAEQFLNVASIPGGTFEDSCGEQARSVIMGDLAQSTQSFEQFKMSLVGFITGMGPIIEEQSKDSFFMSQDHAQLLTQMIGSFNEFKHHAKFTYAVRFAFLNFLRDHDFGTYCNNRDIIKFLIKSILLWERESAEMNNSQSAMQQVFAEVESAKAIEANEGHLCVEEECNNYATKQAIVDARLL